MNHALIALAAGVLLAPSAGELSSRYVVGEVRRTEVSFEETLSLVELKMTVEGEEFSDDFEMDQEEGSKGAVTFEDRILKLEEGELDAFERSYIDLGEEFFVHIADPLGEDLDERGVMTCPLEGRRVRFTRDEAGESFLAEFPEGEEGDPELLEGIARSIRARGSRTSDAACAARGAGASPGRCSCPTKKSPRGTGGRSIPSSSISS